MKKILTLVLGSAIILGACSSEEKPVTGSNGEVATGAEKIALQNCTSCHGGNLSGGPSGPDLTNIGSKYSAEEIEDILNNGRGIMPGKILPENEAKEVAAWLAEQK